ncbi:hypothetical protein ATANTOWER_023986 [Ataeniobius toweri]|uniref:Integrase core domain-containing protein n=1 Tax=Ataeniobius toweri TaxID=208326 RepID=A0ABU7BJ05_9TELE|nr:hypothetical protein [Ataeniobius toweri]
MARHQDVCNFTLLQRTSQLGCRTLDVSSQGDLFSVHQTFLPQLNLDLQTFVEGWNNHPLRTEGNRTPEQMWFLGMMSNPINQPESLQDLQEPDIDWDVAAEYRPDAEGVIVVPEFGNPSLKSSTLNYSCCWLNI